MKEALEAAPDGLDTRELADAVVKAKGWAGGDKALRQSIAHRIVSIMHRHARRGDVRDAGKRAGMRVWRAAR